MARTADPAVRAALIEAAARILATDGPSRLTLRHLAAEVGTSTMAIYTHFGGMDQLRLEVSVEGFRRLAAHLAGVEHTDDPVADLFALGAAYARNARENPHLYRAMFLDPLPVSVPLDVGTPTMPRKQPGAELVDVPSSDFFAESLATLDVLVAAIARCVDTGRFTDDDPRRMAGEVWALTHGLVALELGGMLDATQTSALLGSGARHLAIAFGDSRDATDTSFAARRPVDPG